MTYPHSQNPTETTTTINEIDCSPTTPSSIGDAGFFSGYCPFVPNNFLDITLRDSTQEGSCEYCFQQTNTTKNPAPQISPSEKKLQEEIEKMKIELMSEQEKSSKYSDVISAVADEFTCSICQDVLVAPYTLKDCGHTFCGQCLLRWLNMKKNMCPECRAKVVNKTKAMCPDFKLGSAISKLVYKSFTDEQISEYEERERNWRNCGGIKLLKKPERRAKTNNSRPARYSPTRSPTPTPPSTPQTDTFGFTSANDVTLPFSQEWSPEQFSRQYPQYPLPFHAHLQNHFLRQPYILP